MSVNAIQINMIQTVLNRIEDTEVNWRLLFVLP